MEGATLVEAADEVRWWPDGEWFAVVAVIHVLLAAPWVAWFGWLAAAVAGLSLAWHGRALAGREVWRFRFVDDRVVILAPESTPENPGSRGCGFAAVDDGPPRGGSHPAADHPNARGPTDAGGLRPAATRLAGWSTSKGSSLTGGTMLGLAMGDVCGWSRV